MGSANQCVIYGVYLTLVAQELSEAQGYNYDELDLPATARGTRATRVGAE